MHTALVSRLIKDRSAWELAHVPVEAEPTGIEVLATLPRNPIQPPALVSA
jgi:hypothetical protein